MNAYDLKELLVVLDAAGITDVLVSSDVRADAADATLFFVRPGIGRAEASQGQ